MAAVAARQESAISFACDANIMVHLAAGLHIEQARPAGDVGLAEAGGWV